MPSSKYQELQEFSSEIYTLGSLSTSRVRLDAEAWRQGSLVADLQAAGGLRGKRGIIKIVDMGRPKPAEDLAQRLDVAAFAPRHLIEPFFKETAKEVLAALARNPNLKGNDLLRLLERKDLAT